MQIFFAPIPNRVRPCVNILMGTERVIPRIASVHISFPLRRVICRRLHNYDASVSRGDPDSVLYHELGLKWN